MVASHDGILQPSRRRKSAGCDRVKTIPTSAVPWIPAYRFDVTFAACGSSPDCNWLVDLNQDRPARTRRSPRGNGRGIYGGPFFSVNLGLGQLLRICLRKLQLAVNHLNRLNDAARPMTNRISKRQHATHPDRTCDLWSECLANIRA